MKKLTDLLSERGLKIVNDGSDAEHPDDELLMDAMVIARFQIEGDLGTMVTVATTEGMDGVVQLGLLEAAKQVTSNMWVNMEELDE